MTDTRKKDDDLTSHDIESSRRDTRPIQRRAVLLCSEEVELSSGVVRLVDLAWRREVCIEVVVALGDDPMRALTQRYPFAVFLLVRNGVSTAELRESYEKHRAGGHVLVELDAGDLDDEGPVLDTIERALRGEDPSHGEPEPAPAPRRGRRLICTDAITLAAELRRS